MYCVLFTAKLMGAEPGTSFQRTRHSSAPVLSLRALNQRSIEPMNIKPPAVARIPEVSGAR
jgi:hypothetical protein